MLMFVFNSIDLVYTVKNHPLSQRDLSKKITENIKYTNSLENILTIESVANFSSDCDYEISSSMGHVILSGKSQGTFLEIDCAGLSSGIYFITFNVKLNGLRSIPVMFVKK